MQHRLPHPSPRGGYFVALRLAAVAALAAVAGLASVPAPAALVVVFAMTPAVPSQS